jgi:hypothetical protein
MLGCHVESLCNDSSSVGVEHSPDSRNMVYVEALDSGVAASSARLAAPELRPRSLLES